MRKAKKRWFFKVFSLVAARQLLADLAWRRRMSALLGSLRWRLTSGFWLLGQKVGNAIAPLFFTQILAAYGWIATQDGGASVDQPDAAVAALRWSLTLVPAGLFAVSVPLYLWLDRQAKGAQEAA